MNRKILMVGLLVWVGGAYAQVRSVTDCHDILRSGRVTVEQATQIADFVKARYKKADLSKNQHRVLMDKTDDGGAVVLWALRAKSGSSIGIYAEKGRHWPMIELGKSGLFVQTEKFGNFTSVHFRYDVNGLRWRHERVNRFGFESYKWSKDSLKQPGVPEGKLISMGVYKAEKGPYAGTERKWWIYVPAQYKKDTPAKLIVFQDGAGFIKGDGNACIVMDNLIHQKRMPVTIGVFIDPGEFPAKKAGGTRIRNRGNEYDTCTPTYAEFLESDILPKVYAAYSISKDPSDHCIAGSSSGASCAFTAAWHRNDLFRRVISFVGSYCDFRSLNDYPLSTANKSTYGPYKTAHDYPALIRKTNPPKKIRVFLQDGRNDLDNNLGNWFQNNQRMAAALAFSGYQHNVAWGDGMHSKRHGMAILPEIMEWVWE